MGLDLKTILNKGLVFLNMGSAFKWFATRKSRRDKPFFYFQGQTYTYGKTYEEALRHSSNPADFALRVKGILATSDMSWDEFEKVEKEAEEEGEPEVEKF